MRAVAFGGKIRRKGYIHDDVWKRIHLSTLADLLNIVLMRVWALGLFARSRMSYTVLELSTIGDSGFCEKNGQIFTLNHRVLIARFVWSVK